MTELSATARRAVEAATDAGASDAEAYVSRDNGREVRAHGGEVESLTAATQSGVGIRAWIGQRVGYAYGTDLSEPGVAAIAARATEAAGAADEDEYAEPPQPAEFEALQARLQATRPLAVATEAATGVPRGIIEEGLIPGVNEHQLDNYLRKILARV